MQLKTCRQHRIYTPFALRASPHFAYAMLQKNIIYARTVGMAPKLNLLKSQAGVKVEAGVLLILQ
jgi:hypothetical protein